MECTPQVASQTFIYSAHIEQFTGMVQCIDPFSSAQHTPKGRVSPLSHSHLATFSKLLAAVKSIILMLIKRMIQISARISILRIYGWI